MTTNDERCPAGAFLARGRAWQPRTLACPRPGLLALGDVRGVRARNVCRDRSLGAGASERERPFWSGPAFFLYGARPLLLLRLWMAMGQVRLGLTPC